MLSVALLTIASGSLLVKGFVTRFAAVMPPFAGVSSMFSLFANPNLHFLRLRQQRLWLAVIAAAVVCLGPGAFSLDARLFGRREIIIPRASQNN
jgi:uncharacterized membrane protein YphA (DoxX/SURF4 family)